ncbi:MAG: VWA domain-containing protein [Saprospiraceae bacterium]|nr:VWA domain-containing protein [Saprospiraceae bacterium]
MNNLLLYNLFEQTRDRYNRHLGLSDYMLLLDAMQQGFGVGKKEDLEDLCSMLWLKSKPQQEQFKVFLTAYLKEESEQLFKTTTTQKPTETLNNQDDTQQNPDVKEQTQTPQTPNQTQANTPSVSDTKETVKTGTGDGNDMVTVQWNIGKMVQNVGTTLNTEGVGKGTWKPSNRYILSEAYHPFTERQLRQQWRRLRKKQKVGHTPDIDIEATIKNIATKGFFDAPIHTRRAVNDFRLVVLVDWKGSMLAFHSLSDLIVRTLRAELPKTEVWYFRNQPQDYFYGQADWTKAITTDKLLNQLAQSPTHILIISDGGAARGSFVTERLQAWWRFFNKLKPMAANILWLNPMPKERWAGSTAAYLEKMVAMRAVSDEGRVIKDVVKVLKM